MPNDIDFIAASFVRKAEDLDNIRQCIQESTGQPTDIKIISKIENQEGLINFDDILKKTDAVMVARGDLGMEVRTRVTGRPAPSPTLPSFSPTDNSLSLSVLTPVSFFSQTIERFPRSRFSWRKR